ncbi:MAG: sigma-70 family RNA polymerase sigma factor [Candidatus Nanoarchaeia archaeon]|nr:sigma-70 family RNA polymerase sigma factor [Candidatus Nanoarchaeia archaeon]
MAERNPFDIGLYLAQVNQTPFASGPSGSYTERTCFKAETYERNQRFGKIVEQYHSIERRLLREINNLEAEKAGKESPKEESEELIQAREKLAGHRRENLQECIEAKQGISQSALLLVVRIATRYSERTGVEIEELTGYGNIGLMIAAKKFDWRRGYRFTTYASGWIKQSITRGLQSERDDLHLPSYAHQISQEIDQLEGCLKIELGREPTDEELLERYSTRYGNKVKKKKRKKKYEDPVKTLIRTRNRQRLGVFDSEEDTDYDSCIEDTLTESPSELVEKAMDYELAWKYLNSGGVDERERVVLIHRLGLNGNNPKTLKEVGKMLNLTRERIRQLESEGLGKLREHFNPEYSSESR